MSELEVLLQLVDFAQEASVSLIFLWLAVRASRRADTAIEQHIYDLRIQANHPIPQSKQTPSNHSDNK